MASRSLLKPDNTNTLLLSNIVEYFGEFNLLMKQYLELVQEEDSFINLMDDYFPFKYNSIDDLLNEFDKLIIIKDEIAAEYD